MKRVHITNIGFEEELSDDRPIGLYHILSKRSLFIEMQFLPLLFADEHDTIIIYPPSV